MLQCDLLMNNQWSVKVKQLSPGWQDVLFTVHPETPTHTRTVCTHTQDKYFAGHELKM